MADHQYGFDTLCLHAGQIPDAATGSRAVPIYQTTSYVFDSPEEAASLFNLQTFGNVYSRISNPTVAVFEERVAALEAGRAAVATGSGMAAQMIALLNICEAGDQIVAARTLYGGTHTQLDVNFRKLGIDTVFVDPDDPENFAHAITPRTKAIYAETLGNPSLNVLDIEAVAKIANGAGLPLFIDNTFASPYLCRPFEWGAAISVHSATKFLGGHGTTMGGVIVESGKFPWDNGKFPAMTDPSPGYHGVRFFETFGDFGFTMKCRMEGMRTFGPVLSPFAAFQLLQGVETLPLRMDRHCASALAVARHLESHPKVAWVNYPGLESSRYHALAKKYLPRGAGAVLSFGIKGGAAAGQKFIDSVEFLSHLANIGDAKTLVIHPASTTHRQLSEEQQVAAGVPPDLIRLSVGLETLDDILWDIDQALGKT
ncbi:O-acetylhomoserine aminocarboxypropyltransferase/cysteine synthase family protein [Thauera linaloolentis]|uniref:OAH/OAS sulfhydrylase n=1 Tax=Thauera linaloolentis (strain DSM 12138 / JCM 21573 / CCUG 41526 / CIP 105981 / IAM 15112 / NBRC 102519 / 47Lol) TaxID=1123367 RepID=N6Y334_THAL4|nr:O-acetylhomoserine aminocarboxypropyltransferase/cysteine synthase family protein [Thauera linaloolentis]ENO85935.1 OAH/OAS sulfhydrylase [Thauera linaloolentis 47Lol = DSM 12138]MCM8567493.1 O-acetylhomoserine aminocarboxypropyltransferase/cysteine synthase [Thauera linaloolentis]